MEETISLQDIFKLLKDKLFLILTMMFIGLGLSALVTFFVITPKYSASSELIATFQSKESNVNTDNINTNLMMINTYKDFIKGKVVTEEVQKELAETSGFEGTAEDIKNMVSVEQSQNSQMFTIKAISSNPKEAANVSNAVAETFQKQAGQYTDADKISIISPAEVATSPVSPNKTVNLAIGLVLGMIVGLGLALISEMLNREVKSEDFVTDVLELPVIGFVPMLEDKAIKGTKKNQVKALDDKNFVMDLAEAEAYNVETDGLDQDLEAIESGRFIYPSSDNVTVNHSEEIPTRRGR